MWTFSFYYYFFPIDTSINQIETSTDQIETIFNQIETTIGQIETTNNQIETTVNQIETTNNQIKTTINQIKTTVNPIKTTINKVPTPTPNKPKTIVNLILVGITHFLMRNGIISFIIHFALALRNYSIPRTLILMLIILRSRIFRNLEEVKLNCTLQENENATTSMAPYLCEVRDIDISNIENIQLSLDFEFD